MYFTHSLQAWFW